MALRAHRAHQLERLREAIVRNGDLKPFFCAQLTTLQDQVGFHDYLNDLTIDNIHAHIDNNDKDTSQPPWKKQTRRQHLQKRLAQWAPKTRRAFTLNITSVDDIPADDTATSAQRLFDHWSPIFTDSPTDADAQEHLLRHVQALPSDFKHIVDFDSFLKIIRSTADTAPGPDGVPYSAWAASIDTTGQIFTGRICTFSTIILSPTVSISHIWFLFPRGQIQKTSTYIPDVRKPPGPAL